MVEFPRKVFVVRVTLKPVIEVMLEVATHVNWLLVQSVVKLGVTDEMTGGTGLASNPRLAPEK